jgi:hypothetical protein
MKDGHSITIVSAADSRYFHLLQGLVRSLKAGPKARAIPLSILDIGLAVEQRRWLETKGVVIAVPEWEFEFPGRDHIPTYFKALAARPSLPKYFPGHEIYLWLDGDTWVQDDSVLSIFFDAACRSKLAIVPEIDRGYWTIHKRPRLWGQNQKCFAWAFGWRAGYEYGRHPILNAGVFALHRDAPHWRLWATALRRVLTRRRWTRPSKLWNFYYSLGEQTALNYVVHADGAPAALLPAYCSWFCGKGTPLYDRQRGWLVEPEPPHQPLGIVHLAGEGMKDRRWRVETLQGDTVETMLTYEAVSTLATTTAASPAE